jgi:hypothetical protein
VDPDHDRPTLGFRETDRQVAEVPSRGARAPPVKPLVLCPSGQQLRQLVVEEEPQLGDVDRSKGHLDRFGWPVLDSGAARRGCRRT